MGTGAGEVGKKAHGATVAEPGGVTAGAHLQ